MMMVTEEQCQRLRDTDENLLRLLRQWDDTIAAMHVAISELCRVAMVISERKHFVLSRLKLRRDLIRKENKPTKYLDG